MIYWIWLLGLSLGFIAAERLWPRRTSQRLLRRGIYTDLAYVACNGHFLGLLLAVLSKPLESGWTAGLAKVGVRLDLHIAKTWPWAAQLLFAFVAIDLAQWGIHNLMHRVPWFWEFHKVHHSIEELDWLGSMRFHWVEVVIYKSLQYPLLALSGFDYRALFIIAVVSTLIGHYNHSNVRLDLGALKYLCNGPEMHEWHHTHPDAGPENRNFAINLSLWDWIFGTAYLPIEGKRSPRRLGFRDMERFPRAMLLQELWPLTRKPRNRQKH